MLILLPTNGERRILYGISTDYLTGGILRLTKWKTRIREVVPHGPSATVPVLYKYKEIAPHRYRLTATRVRVTSVTATSVRRILLESFKPFIIEERKWWKPADAWHRVSWACDWCRRYWVVTNKTIYPSGTEPGSLFIRKLLILGPVVVMVP